MGAGAHLQTPGCWQVSDPSSGTRWALYLWLGTTSCIWVAFFHSPFLSFRNTPKPMSALSVANCHLHRGERRGWIPGNASIICTHTWPTWEHSQGRGSRSPAAERTHVWPRCTARSPHGRGPAHSKRGEPGQRGWSAAASGRNKISTLS